MGGTCLPARRSSKVGDGSLTSVAWTREFEPAARRLLNEVLLAIYASLRTSSSASSHTYRKFTPEPICTIQPRGRAERFPNSMRTDIEYSHHIYRARTATANDHVIVRRIYDSSKCGSSRTLDGSARCIWTISDPRTRCIDKAGLYNTWKGVDG